MILAAGLDSRFVVSGVIVAAGLVYALAAFIISWLRSTPEERTRWTYRGSHDGGGGLGPTYARWRGRHRDR